MYAPTIHQSYTLQILALIRTSRLYENTHMMLGKELAGGGGQCCEWERKGGERAGLATIPVAQALQISKVLSHLAIKVILSMPTQITNM